MNNLIAKCEYQYLTIIVNFNKKLNGIVSILNIRN